MMPPIFKYLGNRSSASEKQLLVVVRAVHDVRRADHRNIDGDRATGRGTVARGSITCLDDGLLTLVSPDDSQAGGAIRTLVLANKTPTRAGARIANVRASTHRWAKSELLTCPPLAGDLPSEISDLL